MQLKVAHAFKEMSETLHNNITKGIISPTLLLLLDMPYMVELMFFYIA